MNQIAKMKTDLRVVRKMLHYYETDYKKNSHNWDENFKEFIKNRIKGLKKDELALMKGLDYA